MSLDNLENSHENTCIENRRCYLVEFFDIRCDLKDHVILNKINGYAVPGEILALMGPVGAGKTTLLNILSQRNSLTKEMKIMGKINANRIPMSNLNINDIGYVMQDDILFPKMTLRETIRFYAFLRLPDSMSFKNKIKRAYEVIEMVNLNNHLNTVIGGGIVRGLSGGERKRVSVAIELLTNPSILFLDEPTSGLDSSIAHSLISLLKNLTTKYQLTVICSIHQPNSQIFHFFDKLLLLSCGTNYYFGSVEKLSNYFVEFGQPCPRGWNIADFAIELLQIDSVYHKNLLDFYKQKCNPYVEDYTKYNINQQIDCINFNTSSNGCFNINNPTHSKFQSHSNKYMTSYGNQFISLLRRSFYNSITEYFTFLNFLENIVMGILIATVWAFIPFNSDYYVSITGLFFFICSTIVIQPLYAYLFGFPKEIVIIIRELLSNSYHLLVYFIAKQIAEIPILLTRPLLILTIFYWLVGFKGFYTYLLSFVILSAVSFISYAMAVCLGCAGLSNRETISMTLIYLILSIAFGGFFSRSTPYWLKWARFLSPIYHGYCLLFYSQFKHHNGIKCTSTNRTIFSDCTSGKSSVSLESLLLFDDITQPYWMNIVVIIIYIIVIESVSYFLLMLTLRLNNKRKSCRINILKRKNHFKNFF